MVKVIKMRLIDYQNEKEMMQHLQNQVEEFRRCSDDLKIEMIYRFGKLDHVFLFLNWKRG